MTKTSSAEYTDSDSEMNSMNSPKRSNNQHTDYAEWLLQKASEAIKNPVLSVKKLASYIMENGGYRTFDFAAQWLIRHPFAGLILFIALLLSMPFLIIIGLGFSVAVITFTGFIFLEGTLLTFASVLSFGCLGALAIVLISAVVFILSVYMGFAYIYDLFLYKKIFVNGSEGIALAKFLRKENSDATSNAHQRNNPQEPPFNIQN